MPAPRIADLSRNAEALGNDGAAFCHCDHHAFGVAQLVGLASAQNLADAVDQAGRDGTKGLLMVVPLADHQAPVDLGQSGINTPGGIGREIECPLDPIIAGLRDGLAWLAAEAAELMQPGEPRRLMQHAEHEWPER